MTQVWPLMTSFRSQSIHYSNQFVKYNLSGLFVVSTTLLDLTLISGFWPKFDLQWPPMAIKFKHLDSVQNFESFKLYITYIQVFGRSFPIFHPIIILITWLRSLPVIFDPIQRYIRNQEEKLDRIHTWDFQYFEKKNFRSYTIYYH